MMTTQYLYAYITNIIDNCNSIQKIIYSDLNCSFISSVSYLSLSQYQSITGNFMGNTSCTNGIKASCSDTIPYDTTSPNVVTK